MPRLVSLVFASLLMLSFLAIGGCDISSSKPARDAQGNAIGPEGEPSASQEKGASGTNKVTPATRVAQTGKPGEGEKPGIAGPEAPAREFGPNHLAKETSPYLLQHAHNPVDWYPWGPQALEKARRENKLIFLSIGYSSCYWCHVMERESFTNKTVAQVMNDHFVCIKVDREERPDIDDIYMTSLQLATGQGGGWPLSMFLTPEGKPFYGATYLPAAQFLAVLTNIHEMWDDDTDKIEVISEQLTSAVQQQMRQRVVLNPLKLEPQRLTEVEQALADEFDSVYGGFGYNEANAHRPKFPDSSSLLLLLTLASKEGGDDARNMLLKTLDQMALGGIRDHVGGGFHRYSTDRYWHIPHFEKMLYDNAQLLSLYTRAWQLTSDPNYRRVAQQIADYLLREMLDKEGGFYAALDAETDGVEGRFYVWSQAELQGALEEKELELLAVVYGTSGPPNFEEFYALIQQQPTGDLAKELGLTTEELNRRLDKIHAKLLVARNIRKRPRTDTKILTGWNGLLIRGLAEAGSTFDREDYLQAAKNIADFLLTNLRDENSRLLHVRTAGESKIPAYLDDYALLIDGLIALHETTGDPRWLDSARELTEQQISSFADESHGGFFFTPDDHEALIARGKKPMDSATPSGNAVSVSNLVYLAKADNESKYLQRAEKTVQAFTALYRQFPQAMPRMAVGIERFLEVQPTIKAQSNSETSPNIETPQNIETQPNSDSAGDPQADTNSPRSPGPQGTGVENEQKAAPLPNTDGANTSLPQSKAPGQGVSGQGVSGQGD